MAEEDKKIEQIKEGIYKGGRNDGPSTPRPDAEPAGQGTQTESGSDSDSGSDSSKDG